MYEHFCVYPIGMGMNYSAVLNCNGDSVTAVQLTTLWMVKYSVGLLLSLHHQPFIHKVVHTGILSCCSYYFESIIHYYWILQRERLLGQIKSSSTTRALEMECFFVLHDAYKNRNTLMSCLNHNLLLWPMHNRAHLVTCIPYRMLLLP